MALPVSQLTALEPFRGPSASTRILGIQVHQTCDGMVELNIQNTVSTTLKLQTLQPILKSCWSGSHPGGDG